MVRVIEVLLAVKTLVTVGVIVRVFVTKGV